MKKRALWITVAIIVIGGGAALLLSNGGEDMLEVQTATVGLESIVQKVNATGRIQPKTQVRISADVSAKIMRLHGDEVVTGSYWAISAGIRNGTEVRVNNDADAESNDS